MSEGWEGWSTLNGWDRLKFDTTNNTYTMTYWELECPCCRRKQLFYYKPSEYDILVCKQCQLKMRTYEP